MKKFFTLAALLLVASMANAQFVTKALNDNDEPTFNWNKAVKFIPIAISESVGEAMPVEDVVFDATIDDNRNFLYVWEETYAGVDQDGSLNSFGQPEDHIAMNVTTFGWSGCGFCAVNATQDWSVLDDSWVFHFAIKSTDNAGHQIVIGVNHGFTLGETEVNNSKVLGNFERNGEWYYVDIPFSVIRQLADVAMWGDDPTAYTGNYLKILSGGVQGTQLRLDNIFTEYALPSYFIGGRKIIFLFPFDLFYICFQAFFDFLFAEIFIFCYFPASFERFHHPFSRMFTKILFRTGIKIGKQNGFERIQHMRQRHMVMIFLHSHLAGDDKRVKTPGQIIPEHNGESGKQHIRPFIAIIHIYTDGFISFPLRIGCEPSDLHGYFFVPDQAAPVFRGLCSDVYCRFLHIVPS